MGDFPNQVASGYICGRCLTDVTRDRKAPSKIRGHWCPDLSPKLYEKGEDELGTGLCTSILCPVLIVVGMWPAAILTSPQ